MAEIETPMEFLAWIRSILGDKHWSFKVVESRDVTKYSFASRATHGRSYYVWVSCSELAWSKSVHAPTLAALKKRCETELWQAIRDEWARQTMTRQWCNRPDVIDVKQRAIGRKPAAITRKMLAIEDQREPVAKELPGQKRLALTYQPTDVELIIP